MLDDDDEPKRMKFRTETDPVAYERARRNEADVRELWSRVESPEEAASFIGALLEGDPDHPLDVIPVKDLRQLKDLKESVAFGITRIDVPRFPKYESQHRQWGLLLHQCCRTPDDPEWKVEVLLSMGADPFSVDIHDRTPLFYALEYGSVHAVEKLVAAGADIMEVFHQEPNMFHEMARYGYGNMLQTVFDLLTSENVSTIFDSRGDYGLTVWECHGDPTTERTLDFLRNRLPMKKAQEEMGVLHSESPLPPIKVGVKRRI